MTTAKTEAYEILSTQLTRYNNWGTTTYNSENADDIINAIMQFAPSGSGIDNGIELDRDKSTNKKLVFTFGYHHMNDNGMYTHWTQHKLNIAATFVGLEITMTGRDKKWIEDSVIDTFFYWLMEKCEIKYSPESKVSTFIWGDVNQTKIAIA